MSNETVYTLVPSTNRGRYALDDPQGYDLTSGQPVSLLLGDCWIEGSIEHSANLYAHDYHIPYVQGALRGYYFIANNGMVCGLCTGMSIRLR